MIYAIASVGDRDIPAKQWTKTQPLASLTLSEIRKQEWVKILNLLKQLHEKQNKYHTIKTVAKSNQK